MSVTYTHPNIRQVAISGGAAGNHTLTGITTKDVILGVSHITGDGTQLTGGEDLTAEFSITADDTINNTGGTSSANGVLIVLYAYAHAQGGDLNR